MVIELRLKCFFISSICQQQMSRGRQKCGRLKTFSTCLVTLENCRFCVWFWYNLKLTWICFWFGLMQSGAKIHRPLFFKMHLKLIWGFSGIIQMKWVSSKVWVRNSLFVHFNHSPAWKRCLGNYKEQNLHCKRLTFWKTSIWFAVTATSEASY